MPENARVSVNIPGWTVEPLGSHEPCRTDGPMYNTIILQSPASPVRMETKVSDVIVSTLPGGPEMVGVLDSARAKQPGHHSSSVRPYHQDRCILTGLGSNLQRHVDGGTLERGGGRTTHQLFGTQGSHSSFEGFPESRHAATTPESGTPSPTSYPSGNGQYNCCRLCEQEGGDTQSPSLSLLALELWSFLLTQGSCVTARHLPGVLNVEADAASRVFNMRTEWMLRKDVFLDIAHHFYVPEIDLFVSRLNHQLPLYVSRLPDPSAAAVDAFQQDWSQWKSFIHPPVVLLSRILQKVRSDKATALLVAPDWPGQPWYAQIQLMLTGTPYPLPKEKSLLSLPFDQEAVHPLWRSLNLTVWPISGQPSRRQVSLKR